MSFCYDRSKMTNTNHMKSLNLNKKTKKILEAFIDGNNKIITYAINPYDYIKSLVGGTKPIPYYTLANLKRRGYLKNTEIDKKILYKLTPKGYELIKKIIIERAAKNKKEWDGKWRILIFDIPENKRVFRDNLRKILKEIGFYRLQKSVWIYPYDAIEYIYTLIPSAKESKWFNYIIADHVSFETNLKKIFGLK